MSATWNELITARRSSSADVASRHEALQALYARALSSGDAGLMRGVAAEFEEVCRRIEQALPPRAARGEAQRELGWLADEIFYHADALREAVDDADTWARSWRVSRLTWR